MYYTHAVISRLAILRSWRIRVSSSPVALEILEISWTHGDESGSIHQSISISTCSRGGQENACYTTPSPFVGYMPLRRCRRETKEQCTRVEVQTTARERREKSEPPASTAQDCCRAYLLVVEEVVAVPLANTLLSETRCRDEVKRCQQEVCAAKYRKYPSTPPRWFPIFELHPPLPFSKCVLEGRGSIRRFKKFNSSSGVETEIGSGRESQKEIVRERERERSCRAFFHVVRVHSLFPSVCVGLSSGILVHVRATPSPAIKRRGSWCCWPFVK